MHGAGAREPRRSGNPFLDDSDDDDDGGAGSSGVTAAPGPAFPAFTTLPPEASQSSTASLQSPQDTSALVSMPAKQPTDSQATTQQSVGTAAAAAAVQQHTPVAHTAVVSSDVAPGSALGMDRQASRQQSGQVSSRAGQVSDRTGQVSGIMQQGSLSHMPTTPHPPSFPTNQQPTGNQPQAPSLPTEPAVPSNRSEATAAAAYAGARQQGSTGVGSASDRQANVPFVQEAVPVAKPDDRQPLPAAPPLQPSQAPAGSLQEVQALQPPEQGSQAAPLSLQRLDSQQHGASTRLHADAQAQSAPESRDVLVPPGHTQAAARQAQAGMSSAQGPVNRGSADPALPLQQQSGFPRAPEVDPPPTASMPVYAPPFTGDPLPSWGGQQGVSVPREHKAKGLEGMLGRSAPDSDTEEEESAASAQDRQKFMKSLQSPDQGSSRSRNLVQGFGRMRAKAKDMLQAKNAGSPSGPNTRSAQQAPSQGSADDASHTPTDVELGKRGRLARDMTLMFGLKKPANQQ